MGDDSPSTFRSSHADDDEESEMAPLNPTTITTHLELTNTELQTEPHKHRVYKRRFFGLLQLVLLNIIVSWDVCF